MSGVFQEVMAGLGISQAVSSVYHPESQGALERAHQTLKTTLKTYCAQFPGDWDTAVPFVVFTYRDAVNEFTGLSPFELVFGHEVRGPLKLLKEQLMQLQTKENMLQYVSKFRDRLWFAGHVVRENLKGAQARMKVQFDKRAVKRSFDVGDQVLALIPQQTSSLGSLFSGPYSVLKKVRDRNYIISTPNGKRKDRLCHVNILKRYVGRAPAPAVACLAVSQVPEEISGDDGETVGFWLWNNRALQSLDSDLAHIPAKWQSALRMLLKEFAPLVRDVPSQTTCAVHYVDVVGSLPIRQHPYRPPPSKQQVLKEELS